MNRNDSIYKYEFAGAQHSDEISEIIENDKSPGDVSLIYSRRPDAMKSFNRESPETKVMICKNMADNIIAGIFAISVKKLYFNSSETEIGYLFGLKSREEYRNKNVRIYKGYQEINKEFSNIPFYFTTILNDNIKVQKMLEKKRKLMPDYHPVGNCGFYTLTKAFGKKPAKDFTFRRCTENDSDKIISFLNENGRKMQLFPVISKELINFNNSLNWTDFYFLYKNDEIIACGALWNQKDYKQLYVASYSGIMKKLSLFSNVLTKFGYPKLEKPGNRLKYLSLARWAVKDNNEEYFSVFINELIKTINKDEFILIGLHESNKLNNVLMNKSKYIYSSKLYMVTYNKDRDLSLNNKVAYIETAEL